MKEKNNKPPVKNNRHQRMMQDFRMKKRNLKEQIHFANMDEKEGLLKIWQELKEKHNALSKAANLRKRQVKRGKKRKRFFLVPYKYARNIFDQPKSAMLKTKKKVLEKHWKDSYSDPNWHIPLEYNNNLVWPAIS